MQAPDFWYRKDPSLSATLLAPLAALYDCAGRLNRWMTTPMPAPMPVICVGKLVAGGAGKTPTAIALARLLTAEGHTVHMLTRGYGGQLSGPVAVDPAHHSARDVGDEALLLARVAPTWVGADRRVIAHRAGEAGATVAIMDDGFQNPSLRKTVSLVVVDGEVGLGNGRVMPAGPLREESTRALARADAIVVMGEDRARVGERLRASAPQPLPVFGASLTPTAGARELAGARVFAFAGIARPEKFFASLRAAGCDIAGMKAFPDHYSFRKSDLAALRTAARTIGAKLVTTEKDHVRLTRAVLGDEAADIAIFAVEAVFAEPAPLMAFISFRLVKAAHGGV
jgi:tetraacyldisaccharide 4'-kinase